MDQDDQRDCKRTNEIYPWITGILNDWIFLLHFADASVSPP
jgi:hypothetical protein